jgi:NAD(P)-dependent dehydrogenase (short-subunit alcohol dehydrogenase family)
MGALSGKVAIVTGASRANGMGFASARAMASQGAHVVVTDLAAPRTDLDFEDHYEASHDFGFLEERAKDLEALGVGSLPIAVDVTKPEDIAACVATTEDMFGGIDVLFNNAGTPIGVAPYMDLADQHWNLSYQVHLKGTADFCKAVIPKMIKRGGGAIVNNASIWALKVAGGAAAYVATKAAVVALTKALAVEFASLNIRCNAICPGGITTEMNKVDVALAVDSGVSPEDAQAHLAKDVAMRRLGMPMEIGETVAFLVGDAASYITGAIIPIDGGVTFGL